LVRDAQLPRTRPPRARAPPRPPGRSASHPASSPISALATSDSTIFVGGSFTSIAGQPRNHLAALEASGAATDWNPDINGTVGTLQVFGSTLYAGGQFSSVGPIAQRSFAEFASAPT